MELFKEARLEDESEGFEESTIFELTNGQKWKQIEHYYKYRYKYRPRVRIYKDGMRYFLELEGIDRSVRVEKIE